MPQDPANVADRNLLFGILAVNLNFITRDQLIVAMNTWVLDKNKALDAILLEQKAITPERHALMQALVVEHLRQHQNDPQLSLAAVSSVASVKKDLAKIADQDVEASLAFVAVPRKDEDAGATRTFSVGAITSSGQRFRILRPHARGGLGQVYVAEDQELHRQVALKEIQDKHAADQDSRTRFLMEAEITGALEHPGIVPVYGLGQYADGRPYYAMRFIQGDSLKDAIERFHQADGPNRDPGERTLELRKLLGRFIDVCEAIQYAHDRGILHRDLKPGNIMLGKYGETLVVDWGLAKPMDQIEHASTEPLLKPQSASGTSNTLLGRAVGTPQYMSPEQAAGRLDAVGPSSDVYSLGATLYALLTGKASVEDSAVEHQRQADVGKILDKVIKGNFPRPRQVKPNVAPALEAICLKAMALKSADRYPSPRALASDIESWLADEPVSAWPEPWTVKARRWMAKRRTLVTGVAAAVLVGTISLAVSTVMLANANELIRAESNEKERQRALAVASEEKAVANEARAVASHKKAEERLDQSVETLKLFANDARTYCEDAMVPGDSKDKLFDVLLDQLEAQAAARDVEEFNVDKIRARIFLYETVALTKIELGRTVMAEPSLTKALKLADEWIAAKPDDPGALGRRAAVLHLFGVIHTRRLNAAVAEKYYLESYEIRKKLLGNEKVERFTPGKTRMDLADSLDALERWDEAIDMRLKAYDFVRKPGDKANPALVYFALDALNWTYQKAAVHTKDYGKKVEYLDKANETSAALMRMRKGGRVALDRWVKNLQVYSDTEIEQAALATDASKAQAHLARAKTQLHKRNELVHQLATSKDLLDHRRAYARALYDLGRMEVRVSNDKSAKPNDHLKSCVAVYEEILRDYPVFLGGEDSRLDRLLAVALLGKHEEAAAEVDRVFVKFAGKDFLYRGARIYALCASAVAAGRPPEKLTPEEKKLQETYRDKALNALKSAVSAGYDEWSKLRLDPDFDSVRSDPRFQEILEPKKKNKK
jgi:serine/threonine protein kinase